MRDSNAVLCFSENPDLLDRLVPPLEGSVPDVTVLQTNSADDAIDYLARGDVDTLVTDAGTATATPAIVRAARERYPALSILVVVEYDDGDESGVAIGNVVEFVDAVDDANDAFAGWVANAVVSSGENARVDRVGDVDRPGMTHHDAVVRDVRQGLVDATAPRDVEKAVCDTLTVGDRYRFAWIGEYDRGERQVVPWVTGAAGEDWPTNTTFPVGTGAETVVESALRSHELTIADGFDSEAAEIPWARTAVERGATATAIAPLIDDSEEMLGVLGLYTDDPGGFDAFERQAIRAIADATSHALQTMALRGEAEQQQRTLRRYERLVETVGDGMYALDADGHFMTVNDGLIEMTGFTREELLGEHVSLVVDERPIEGSDRSTRDGRIGDVDPVSRTAEDRAVEPERMEVTLQRKDGDRIPCEAKVATLRKDDQFRGSVGVLRDITEQKRRERELRRRTDRLDALASIVSGAVTDTEPVALGEVVEEAWSNVTTNCTDLRLEASPTIAADRSRLRRLLENLFRNAIEHGNPAGTVSVGLLDSEATAAVDDGSSVGFYVADDGPALPPAVHDRLLEMEFTRAEDGAGIGLWVVKAVASAHGWTTNATESEDGGARFEFGGIEPA